MNEEMTNRATARVLMERARTLLELREKATPVDGAVFREYDHGGGRLFVEAPQRRLILDVYHEGDRDFFFSAHKMADTIAELLDKFERLQWRCDNLMKGTNVLGERADAAEARLRELASAEPVAWRYWKDKFSCYVYADERAEVDGTRYQAEALIRRPEMPS